MMSSNGCWTSIWTKWGANGDAGMEEEEADGPQKKRKLIVRTPLYSPEILSVLKGMVYFLTGFERSEVDLLVKRFDDVRMMFMFCSCPSYVPILHFCVCSFDVLR